MGGAGVNKVSALTEVTISLLQRGKVARFTAADEVLPCVYCQKNLFCYVRTQTRTKSERPCLGDADRVRFANRSIPTFICGRADNACTNLLGSLV